jgi:hypothetical protein
MGIALIVIGLFLCFALAFNGSVGADYVDQSFFTSGLLMVITGITISLKDNWNVVRILCVLSLLTYLPMIWQRFNFSFGVNWVGVIFDIAIAGYLVILIVKKPNKSLKPGTPQSGAP